ncbi:MAG: hypothetical protein JXQ87_02295 [Bacteroidia bacterium]
MKTLKFVFLLVGLTTIAGCVSKKKYEDLSAAKRRSDMKLAEVSKENKELDKKLSTKTKEAKNLDNELVKLKEEFNDMKNEMLENNARKSSLIEDLNRKLAVLSKDNKSATDSLESMLNRLDKKEARYAERQKELKGKLLDLEGIDAALSSYYEKLSSIEKFVTHNIDKNGIPKVFTQIEGGFLYITFDNEALFKTGTLELEADGKRALKVIASALENNAPARITVAANYSEDLSTSVAFKKTNEKGNIISTYLSENAKLTDVSINFSSEKIVKQKLSDNDHAIAFIINPPLGTITKFAE